MIGAQWGHNRVTIGPQWSPKGISQNKVSSARICACNHFAPVKRYPFVSEKYTNYLGHLKIGTSLCRCKWQFFYKFDSFIALHCIRNVPKKGDLRITKIHLFTSLNLRTVFLLWINRFTLLLLKMNNLC